MIVLVNSSQTDVIISTITIQSQIYHLPKTMVAKQPIYVARAIHNTHDILRNLCYILGLPLPDTVAVMLEGGPGEKGQAEKSCLLVLTLD